MSVDRGPKVGATQASGTADDRTRGVGAPQWLAQVALDAELAKGAAQAREVAGPVLERVRSKLGY